MFRVVKVYLFIGLPPHRGSAGSAYLCLFSVSCPLFLILIVLLMLMLMRYVIHPLLDA